MHLIDTLDIVIICTCMSLPLTEHQQYSTSNAVKQLKTTFNFSLGRDSYMKEIHCASSVLILDSPQAQRERDAFFFVFDPTVDLASYQITLTYAFTMITR